MRISGQHIYGLNFITVHFKIQHLVRADLPLLDQPMPRHNDKKLPFRVMPMLPFRNSRFGNINRYLPALFRFQKLGKAPPAVHVHL